MKNQVLLALVVLGITSLSAQNNVVDSITVSRKSFVKTQKLMNDWASLARYSHANKKLESMKERRVVFMGNSITDSWPKHNPEFFSNNSFIGRGISGQTTPQMLVRFTQDVIDLKPSVVVILAGTNDIAGNTGLMTNKMIQDNLAAMAELAKANGIKVVMSSVLPVLDYPWKPGLSPASRVVEINAWMKEYAKHNDIIYLDYFSAMVDDRNGMKQELAYDGVHPNKSGYAIMEDLVLEAILEAIGEK